MRSNSSVEEHANPLKQPRDFKQIHNPIGKSKPMTSFKTLLKLPSCYQALGSQWLSPKTTTQKTIKHKIKAMPHNRENHPHQNNTAIFSTPNNNEIKKGDEKKLVSRNFIIKW